MVGRKFKITYLEIEVIRKNLKSCMIFYRIKHNLMYKNIHSMEI